jgi:hypothetical protein
VEIRAAARRHAPDAFAELARLSKHAKSEQVRIAAIKEILDRAYGKSRQPVDGDGEGGPTQIVVRWLSAHSQTAQPSCDNWRICN